MDYDFRYNCYLELKYLPKGKVEAKALTVSRAEELGYEDGYVRNYVDYKLYVKGFSSIEAIHRYVKNMAYCTLIE